MFRQKIDQITDCSCRLLPNQSNQYFIFKPQNSHTKPINKEPKQKLSLKSQIAFSNKQQNKVTSAQKTSLKAVKHYQDEKQSISAITDINKKKLQKNLICSPENSHLKKMEQNFLISSNMGSDGRNFNRIQNNVKTAQNNKLKQPKKGQINSHKLDNPKVQQNRRYMVSNFGNQNTTHMYQQINKKEQIPKKSLNFEQYYKYVSNPYAANQKNKQNLQNGDNPQTSRYKIDLKMKKEYRKQRNQPMPLHQVNRNVQTNIFHQSLQKYDYSKQNIRGTFDGSLTTKNSMNSHNDSMKASKNNLVSLMNSKVINFNQNSSLQFNKLTNDRNQFDLHHPNQSQAFYFKNLSSIIPQNNRKNLDGMIPNIIQSQYIENGQNLNPKILLKKGVTEIQRPSTALIRDSKSLVNVNRFLAQQKANQKKLDVEVNGINKISPIKKKITIERLNTFTDIINRSAECESVLGEGQRSSCSNEQSVVIMRYKDLVEEVQGLSEFDHNVLLKPENLQIGSKFLQKQRDNNGMIDSIKIQTSVKPHGKSINNLIQDSTITCNQNMKKTIKYNKDYMIQNFNLIE